MRIPSMGHWWWQGVVVACLFAAGAAGAVTCREPIDVNATLLSNGFGADLSNTRNGTSSINSRNVSRLALVLSHAAVGSSERRGSPVVTTQAIITMAKFTVVAIDRTTGCEYWSYSPFDAAASPLVTGFRSLYFLNEGGGRQALVFAGDLNGAMHAIDAASGRQVWKRFVGTDSANHIITGTPVYANGSLFIPISTFETLRTVFIKGLCCRSHGMVQAVDPCTGAGQWSFNVTPDQAMLHGWVQTAVASGVPPQWMRHENCCLSAPGKI
jgi:polyvinyl alcohol dehydrogenase (cytochrome)